MRRPADYPSPAYRDTRDRRLITIIKGSDRAAARGANILGVPYDGATLGRRGSAKGPAAIRNALRYFSNYNPELRQDLLATRVTDIGDVVIRSNDVVRVHADVKDEVGRAVSKSSLLVLLGGDNSLSLPSITACHAKFGKIGLVVFDSHFDVRYPLMGKPTSGSSYGMAVRALAGLAGSRAVEIGIHGFLNSREYAEEAKRLGMKIFTASDVRRLGPTRVVRRAYATASYGADAVYVSVDLDCVDVSYVSGVSAPSAGGMSADELFEMLLYLGAREKVVCSDIVELAPPLDPTGRSDVVAATALVSLLAGYTRRAGHSARH